MAIALSAKTGVNNTDPDFPFGKIVDGVGTGTPITAASHQDFHQFFAKLLSAAGITANGFLDNNTNGYQYHTALLALINPAFTSTGLVLAASPAFSNTGAPYYNAAYKIDGNEVSLCGVIGATVPAPGTITVLTLPVAARPASTVHLNVPANNGAGYLAMTIDTSGVMSFSTGAGLTVTIYLDGLRFRIS